MKLSVLGCVVGLSLAVAAPQAMAETLLTSRLIDEVGYQYSPPGGYVINFQYEFDDDEVPLFEMPFDGGSVGNTYVYTPASPTFAPFTDMLTDGVSQNLYFRIYNPVTIGVLQSEQDFFGLASTDLAGNTITRIEMEVIDYDFFATGVIVNEINEQYAVELEAEIRVYGESGATAVPTPAALGLGGLLLTGLCLRRNRR